MPRRSAFSVLELLVALLVIGILAALALAKFSSAKDKTYIDAEKNDLRNFTTAAELALDDNGSYPVTPGALSTFHYSRNVSTLGYLPFGEGFHLIVQHAKTATVCGVTFGPARSTAPTCANAASITFSGSASASALVLDASNGLSLSGRQAAGSTLAARAASVSFFGSQAAPLTAGDLPNISYVDWEFGDGTYASFTNATGLKTGHTYADAAEGHIVRLAITYNDGAIALGAGQVAGGTITPVDWNAPPTGSTRGPGTPDTTSATTLPPTAQFIASTASTTTGAPVTFDASSSTAASPATLSSYTWDFGDHATASGVTASHTYSTPGTMTVALTVTDSKNQTATVKHTVTVTANQPPTASFSWSPTSASAGQTITFTASAQDADGTIAAYAWDWGDFSANGTGASATHVFSIGGAQHVQLTVTDNAGGTAIVDSTVTLVSSASASLSVSKSQLYTGDSVRFDASGSKPGSGGTITGYQWCFDGSNCVTTTADTVWHRYATAGSFNPAVTVTDSYGQTARATSFVNVLTNHAPTANFSFSPTSPAAGQTVTFDGSASTDPDSGQATLTYAWTFSDGAKATGKTITHAFASTGTATATLVVTDPYGLASTPNTQNVQVVQTLMSSGIVTNGLIAAYDPADVSKGATVLVDESGKGHNCTFPGGTYAPVRTQSAGIVTFDNSNRQYLTCFADSTQYNWSAMVVAQSVNSSYNNNQGILSEVYGTNRTTNSPDVTLYGSPSGYNYNWGMAGRETSVSNITGTSSWTSYAITSDGSSDWFYVNKVQRSNYMSGPMDVYKTLYLGYSKSCCNTDGTYFNGQMGPALFYNRTLTASEIQQNHNALRSYAASMGYSYSALP